MPLEMAWDIRAKFWQMVSFHIYLNKVLPVHRLHAQGAANSSRGAFTPILLTGLLSDEPCVELEVLETTLSTPVHSSLLPCGEEERNKKYTEIRVSLLHLLAGFCFSLWKLPLEGLLCLLPVAWGVQISSPLELGGTEFPLPPTLQWPHCGWEESNQCSCFSFIHHLTFINIFLTKMWII